VRTKLIIPKKEDGRIIYGRIPLQSVGSGSVSQFKMYAAPNDLKQKFKISPFTKVFEGDNDKIAIFHTFLSKKMFGGKELKECLNDIKETGTGDIEIVEKLLENQFIIPESLPYKEFKENFIKSFRNMFYNTVPNITLMYFILTDRCNLECKYCFIEKGALKGNPHYGDMNWKTAKAGIDFFINQIKSVGEKMIIFYGGEPLLNFDVLKRTVSYAREKEKLGHFKGPVKFQIITNAVLVTPEIAKFFAEEKIILGISIDGPREIHEKMRVSKNSNGSFDETIRGYWLLKNAGTNLGISCTIGKHNIEVLDNVAEYFIKELGVKSVGFNLPNLIKGQEDLMIPMEKIVENIIKAYAVCRKFGVVEDRLWNRRVRTFVEEQFWFTDCAGCGNQIVVLPNGAVGPCHAFLGSTKYFESNVFREEDLTNNPVWREWKKRAPIFMHQCYDCPAISICGGGCAYLAHENYGNILEKEKNICVFCNNVLEWLVGELYEDVYNKSDVFGR